MPNTGESELTRAAREVIESGEDQFAAAQRIRSKYNLDWYKLCVEIERLKNRCCKCHELIDSGATCAIDTITHAPICIPCYCKKKEDIFSMGGYGMTTDEVARTMKGLPLSPDFQKRMVAPAISQEDQKTDFRVVDKPIVKLIGKTFYGDLEIDDFLKERGIKYTTDAVEDADAMAEFAGRLCYWSFNPDRRRHTGEGQNAIYLDHIREANHGSVQEHSTFTFLIDDFSKNCTQELVRHRVGVAYSIQSSRYVDQFSDEYFGNSGHCFGVYIPPKVQACRVLFDDWLKTWNQVYKTYKKTFDLLRSQGLSKKDARSDARHILPGGMCNAVVFTVNCRELNHIFKMRGALTTDREIRELALAMYELVKSHNVFSNWERRTDSNGNDYLHNKDSDKPKHANVEEAIEYFRKHFPNYLFTATPMQFVDDFERFFEEDTNQEMTSERRSDDDGDGVRATTEPGLDTTTCNG